MAYPITWPWPHAEANLAMAMTTLAFLAWWMTGQSTALLRRQIRRHGLETGQAQTVLLKRLVGMLGYGVLPAVVLFLTQSTSWTDYGVRPAFSLPALASIIGLSGLILLLVSRATRNPDSLAQYPEIRRPIWSRRLLVWSALSWLGYLLAYELMFRGFLLFSCARAFGAGPAIVINTAIYCLVHVPKNLREGIGAIPLGLVLCLITLQTGSIWTAVIVHWVMGLANEWFSLRYHPEMRVASSVKKD